MICHDEVSRSNRLVGISFFHIGARALAPTDNHDFNEILLYHDSYLQPFASMAHRAS
jgi:hypothetical protein